MQRREALKLLLAGGVLPACPPIFLPFSRERTPPQDTRCAPSTRIRMKRRGDDRFDYSGDRHARREGYARQ